jgi:protein involved in polysaccharide export with SLBB domain
VQRSDDPEYPPGIGFPIPVRDDGTISLPLLPGPLNVNGKTLIETEKIIRSAYTEPKAIVNLDMARVLISLIQRRTYTVQVLRQETPPQSSISLGANASRRQGTGIYLSLPAYRNDILQVLTRTGGLPSHDEQNEVSIERRLKDGSTKITRIPLCTRAGDPIPFKPSDVLLETGDVVFIGASNPKVQSSIRAVAHTVPATENQRVTVKTAAWLVECDRMVLVNDRELLVEGNVNLLLRQRDMTVRGGRIRINLADGSFHVDGSGSFFAPNNAP